ncbi:MAG TPA: 16S rRNA (guanine(527)-N(7))-methyltransferase RsmG [Solirubrobacteraceae bacterium]|nr:16S rRNA (guanine(527)-N(7))-methyltransferase RsmG [Solirubrobacteraceae bacterium]
MGGPQRVDWDRDGRLTPAQRAQIERVLALLAADEHAPTTVRERERALRTHVLDSLAALELEPVRAAGLMADLGSGSGFPGIALAIALPAAEVALVESQRRKCEFLQRLCAAGDVGNAHVVCARAEEWRSGVGRCEVVLARALAAQPVVLEYAAPLLRMGGALVDWRGRRDEQEERAGERAAALLGLRRVEVREVHPFEDARSRHLHVFVKARETPARYPRRAGVARKRPLGA